MISRSFTVHCFMPLLATVVMLGGCAGSANVRDAEMSVTRKVATFLMFNDGRGVEAMNFYVSLFDDAVVEHDRNAEEADATTTAIAFTIHGQRFMVYNSPMEHPFTFTPAVSISITCDDEAELDRLFAELVEDGQVLMPPADYGFSRKFAWVADRFGVSWQLNWLGE